MIKLIAAGMHAGSTERKKITDFPRTKQYETRTKHYVVMDYDFRHNLVMICVKVSSLFFYSEHGLVFVVRIEVCRKCKNHTRLNNRPLPVSQGRNEVHPSVCISFS